MSKTLDNQLFDIAEVLSGNSGYPIPSRPCFNEMTIDYQLYNLWRAWGGGIDPDAQAFIDASGATDVEGINNFVKGVKALGLWSSMVCWPLRSSQNAGTGSTAYSLGGLGTYNGTLVNGPTWGADGIATNGIIGQKITIGPTGFNAVFGTPPKNNWDMFSVTYSGSSLMGQFQGANAGYEIWLSYDSSGGNVGGYGPWEDNSWIESFSVPLGSGGPSFVQVSRTSSTNVKYVQNGTTKHSATNNTASTIAININSCLLANGRSGFSGDTPIGVTAIQGFFVGTNADQSAIYTLYKSTLGQGLGLS
jgi:hypothetical protein